MVNLSDLEQIMNKNRIWSIVGASNIDDLQAKTCYDCSYSLLVSLDVGQTWLLLIRTLGVAKVSNHMNGSVHSTQAI